MSIVRENGGSMRSRLQLHNDFMNLYQSYSSLVDKYYPFQKACNAFSITFNNKMLHSYVCAAYGNGLIKLERALELIDIPTNRLKKPYSYYNVFVTYRIYTRKLRE